MAGAYPVKAESALAVLTDAKDQATQSMVEKCHRVAGLDRRTAA